MRFPDRGLLPPRESIRGRLRRYAAHELLRGTIAAEADHLWFDEGTAKIVVPGWAKDALRHKVGSRVAMGVRPQAISDVPQSDQAAGSCSLEMKVGVVEFLGDKMEVYLSTANHPHVIAHIEAHRRVMP